MLLFKKLKDSKWFNETATSRLDKWKLAIVCVCLVDVGGTQSWEVWTWGTHTQYILGNCPRLASLFWYLLSLSYYYNWSLLLRNCVAVRTCHEIPLRYSHNIISHSVREIKRNYGYCVIFILIDVLNWYWHKRTKDYVCIVYNCNCIIITAS